MVDNICFDYKPLVQEQPSGLWLRPSAPNGSLPSKNALLISPEVSSCSTLKVDDAVVWSSSVGLEAITKCLKAFLGKLLFGYLFESLSLKESQHSSKNGLLLVALNVEYCLKRAQ